MNAVKTAYLRFYEELNDFLPPDKRKVKFPHNFSLRQSVKDMIESYGVPHAEVDMILVNGISVGFNYIVNDKDEISVYPVFESFDISEVQHLRNKPLREPKFIVDIQLGSLAKYMRMAGFDTIYNNSFKGNEIITISLDEKRTILTKDRELLKRNEVTHGYFVRNIEAGAQLKEIITRFHLQNDIKAFTRCLECNNLLTKIIKDAVWDKIPEKVKEYHNEFCICNSCSRVYWKGSHYDNMLKLLKRSGIN